MKKELLWLSMVLLSFSGLAFAQDEHAGHSLGGGYGSVHFETSCSPASQQQFDQAVAMLHSFFYPETEKAFQAIADREPTCAIVGDPSRQYDLHEVTDSDELRGGTVEILLDDLDAEIVRPLLRLEILAGLDGVALEEPLRVEPTLRDRVAPLRRGLRHS